MEPSSVKRARKSSAADESDNASATKKRGRKSTTKVESENEEEPVRNWKNRKAEKPSKGLKISEEPQPRLHDMAKYMDRESWEDLIDTVDTVERTEEGLFIYFTL